MKLLIIKQHTKFIFAYKMQFQGMHFVIMHYCSVHTAKQGWPACKSVDLVHTAFSVCMAMTRLETHGIRNVK